MIVVLAYCQKDRAEAERLAGWLLEIGGPFPRHQFLIFRHEACPSIPLFESFAAGELVIHDDVFNSWPQSANHVFKKAGKHVEYGTRQPFLWIEPDAVPMHGQAFDLIEDEYKRLGKPFLGDIINDGKGFVPHMSGIGVYPGSIAQHAGEIYFAGSDPWDVFAAAQILPQAAQSEHILHRWKAPPFERYEQITEHILSVRPKCALFHSDKSGTLINLLRGGKPTPDMKPPHLPADGGRLIDTSGKIQSLPASPMTPPPASHPLSKVEPANMTTDGRQKPWANYEQSLVEINALCKRLTEFTKDHPSHTRAVRMVLHEMKLIQLPYRYQKGGKRNWRRKGKQQGKSRQQLRFDKKLKSELELRAQDKDMTGECLFCREQRMICQCVLKSMPV